MGTFEARELCSVEDEQFEQLRRTMKNTEQKA